MNAFRTHGRQLLTGLAATTLLVLPATAASAAPTAGDAGDRHASRSEATTEDTDTNDGGTPEDVADAGDDRHPSGRDRSVEPGRNPNQGNAQHDPDGDTNGGVDQPGGAGGEDLADQDGNNGCGNDDDFEDDNNGNCGGLHHREARERQADEDAEVTGRDRTAVAAEDRERGRSGDHERATDRRSDRGEAEVLGTGLTRTAGADTATDDEAGTDVWATATAATTDLFTPTTEVLGIMLERAPASEVTVASTGEVLAAPAAATASDTEVLGVAYDRAGALPRSGVEVLTLAALGLTSVAGGAAVLRRRR